MTGVVLERPVQSTGPQQEGWIKESFGRQMIDNGHRKMQDSNENYT